MTTFLGDYDDYRDREQHAGRAPPNTVP